MKGSINLLKHMNHHVNNLFLEEFTVVPDAWPQIFQNWVDNVKNDDF